MNKWKMPEFFWKTIPAKVRLRIKRAKGSQDAIAARFGVAQSSVSSIKRGEWA